MIHTVPKLIDGVAAAIASAVMYFIRVAILPPNLDPRG
jgi:hypothetical protein